MRASLLHRLVSYIHRYLCQPYLCHAGMWLRHAGAALRQHGAATYHAGVPIAAQTHPVGSRRRYRKRGYRGIEWAARRCPGSVGIGFDWWEPRWRILCEIPGPGRGYFRSEGGTESGGSSECAQIHGDGRHLFLSLGSVILLQGFFRLLFAQFGKSPTGID